MSTNSRLRNPKQPTPISGRPRQRNARWKPAPLDITAMQREAHAANVEPRHIVHGRKGGKVPGIPFANRKYPHGKHAVAV